MVVFYDRDCSPCLLWVDKVGGLKSSGGFVVIEMSGFHGSVGLGLVHMVRVSREVWGVRVCWDLGFEV